MEVEFRLLGEVDAQINGHAVDLGHARQRSVLAALLIDVNRTVSVDQLVDRVWADRPPYRARNALSAYLSRLRQRLDGTDVRIARAAGGYTLATDPLSIDLHRFRRLVGHARAAGSAAEAYALYEQALQLWHGAPFSTVDTPWFDAVRTSLEAEHLAVVLDRNDTALAAGRHGELLAELGSAVRAHPLDERLAGQLMLAQSRNGRQADALDTYRRIRARLLDELGADPGTTLQAVHQQILSGDIDAPAPRRGDPAPVPDQGGSVSAGNVPRRATSFVGREAELAQLRAALREHPLVTLTGVGGVGKSRLAVEAAGQERARFADGAWFCELAPLDDGAAVSQALAAALRVRQRQDLTIEQSVIEYLSGRELLLVVDNCEHVLDAVARVLDQVVAHCPGVVVLATSREVLGVDGELVLPVAPLPAADGMALFAARARARRPDFRLDEAETGAVAEICRRLDGLPLAIELAAARTRAMNAAEVARRLDGARFLSHGPRSTQAHHQSLEATIDWSYRLLADAEKVLFTRLSVFSGGFDLAAAHGVCGEPGYIEDDTFELLSGLVDKSMVTVSSGPGGSRYRLLETLRAYGRERLRQAATDSPFARSHAHYYARFAEQVAVGLHGRDERAWVERALPDYDNLRTAFERAAADRDSDLAIRLVTSTSELLFPRVGYESADWALRALDLGAEDHPLRAVAVGVAARGAWSRGELAAAVALAGRARGAVPGRGTDRVAYPADVLADVALYQGDAEQALAHYEAEVARARRDADPIRLVATLYYVAVCHAVLRTPERGVPAAVESVDVAETTGNATALSMARYALGLVLKKSDPDRALVLFDDAAQLAGSVRNFWWQGIALMEAAATRSVHGDPADAGRAFVDVLDHWDQVGDWTQQWLNLRYVARLLARVGADEDAVTLHHALVAAGRPSPLGSATIVELAGSLGPQRFDAAVQQGSVLTGAAAVRHARSSLRRVRRPQT
ncbi:MAG: winged helix-turn-helix domain-containing protein [Pseudonocardia sp.]|nr:winged helix-turn-helix domain-containing protein [Pseudonocardia sp.]